MGQTSGLRNGSQVQDASVTALGTDLLILWSYSPERPSSSLVITQLPGAALGLEPSGFTGKPPWEMKPP